ncbi:MAG: hypothetical protein JO356_21560 [Acidobacteria bacterium]|nr:hypothetical protein [Acidobacteriota bacterium]
MNQEETTQQAPGPGAAGERCLCREALDRVQECFAVSPKVRQHFANSRVEFLKALRAVIDERIERISSTGQRGTKVAVE